MSYPTYKVYFRVDKVTHEKEYLQTNMFNTPAEQWLTSKNKADKYSDYDSFFNNAKAMGIVVDTDKYDYDFEDAK